MSALSAIPYVIKMKEVLLDTPKQLQSIAIVPLGNNITVCASGTTGSIDLGFAVDECSAAGVAGGCVLDSRCFSSSSRPKVSTLSRSGTKPEDCLAVS